MTLKLILVQNGRVLAEMPLSMADWPKKRLEHELNSFEQEADKFSRLFDALSHQTRLKMMKRLFEEEDQKLGFGDFMRDLDLNPKIVWENTRKLREGGLLEKASDGKYCCSDVGAVEFLMLSLVLRRLLQALEEL